MEEFPSVQLEAQTLTLSEFLSALFQALEREGLRPCVLRNYEGFPTMNIGNDIDFLIRPSELSRAMRALSSIEGIRIVGYAERQYVANIFLEGVSSVTGIRMQHVDFDLSLSWKGLPYLTTDAVLQAAIPRCAGNLTFMVPCPVHEAIISLFASLLVGRWLKEKYFPEVQRTFAGYRIQVLAALQPQFGLKNARRLVDSIIGGDRGEILGCVRSLRVSLGLRSLLQRPVRSILAIFRHYTNELAIRYSPETLETVCILGPEDSGKATMTEALMPMLRSSAVEVEQQRYTPSSPFKNKSRGSFPNTDSSAESQASSMARVLLWLLDEWTRQFTGKRNLKLRICGTSCYELSIDPERYRYGGPTWFARLVVKLMPSPDLWILLDSTTGVFQSGSQLVPTSITQAQLSAYRSFVKTRKRYVILDASGPPDSVAEGAYAAIVDTLVARTDRKLKNRFQQRKTSN
jgi:hypothetical protein